MEGCRQSECVLLGGETAEMPGFYSPGEYDLAGFAVGSVKKDAVIDGSRIQVRACMGGCGCSCAGAGCMSLTSACRGCWQGGCRSCLAGCQQHSINCPAGP